MGGYIARAVVQNDLYPELFVEPFAGGASVSLALLQAGLVETIGLVDHDPLVAAFWKILFKEPEWLVDRVLEADVTLDSWIRIKETRYTSTRDLAFKCLFLNRTSFSGILTPQAGPIGGKSQRSAYKIDCRFNKDTIVKRLRRVAAFRDRVSFVWNTDWRQAITRIKRRQEKGTLPEKAFFYFDPPFYKKGQSLYTYHFNHNQHVALRNFLATFDQPWILSYDACPEVIALYRDGGFQASDVQLIYTASSRSKREVGKELVVSNLPLMVSELQLGVGRRAARSDVLGKPQHDPAPSSSTAQAQDAPARGA